MATCLAVLNPPCVHLTESGAQSFTEMTTEETKLALFSNLNESDLQVVSQNVFAADPLLLHETKIADAKMKNSKRIKFFVETNVGNKCASSPTFIRAALSKQVYRPSQSSALVLTIADATVGNRVQKIKKLLQILDVLSRLRVPKISSGRLIKHILNKKILHLICIKHVDGKYIELYVAVLQMLR